MNETNEEITMRWLRKMFEVSNTHTTRLAEAEKCSIVFLLPIIDAHQQSKTSNNSFGSFTSSRNRQSQFSSSPPRTSRFLFLRNSLSPRLDFIAKKNASQYLETATFHNRQTSQRSEA